MSDLTVVHRENLEPFDKLNLNADHRLNFEDGELTAVYPSNAEETAYRVALFPVEDGGVTLPDGAAVLSADDTVVALVPERAYQGGDN